MAKNYQLIHRISSSSTNISSNSRLSHISSISIYAAKSNLNNEYYTIKLIDSEHLNDNQCILVSKFILNFELNQQKL